MYLQIVTLHGIKFYLQNIDKYGDQRTYRKDGTES